MIKLKFTVPGNPVTKKNSQRIVQIRTVSGKHFHKILPSEAFEKYQKECGRYMPMLDEPVEIPVNMKCTYYMQTRRRVDLLNLLEATADILVDYGVLADDNCKIVRSTDGSRVLYDKENPRVEIEIKEIDG